MDQARPETTEKQKAIRRFMDEHEYILIHINSGAEGVILPEHLYASKSVTLKLSHFFRKPTHLTKEKIIAELLFNSSYFSCTVPYEAIWGVTTPSGENLLWPNSTPQGFFDGMVEQQTGKEPEAEPKKQRGNHLRRVK